jgi:hypothetical protein
MPTLISGSRQSLVEIAEQVVAIVRLVQEAYGSRLHRVYPHVFIRIGRDENNGDAMTTSD